MTEFVLLEMPHAEKMQLLEDSEWANEFTSIQLDCLAKYLKSYTLQSQLPVMEEGETNDLLCLLCEGKVDIVKQDGNGQVKKIQTLGEGKVFGELSFFDRGPGSASVIAQGKIKLLILHRDEFSILSAHSPAVALKMVLGLIKSLSQRLRQTTGKLMDFL